MEIGIVGLGRMGAGMARRLARGGARVVCYDQAEAARQAFAEAQGMDCVENLAALCARLNGERVIVLSLPAGEAVEDAIRDLLPLASSGDTIVDCGNSYYRDSKRRALALSQQGLRYIDAGVSGGIHGLEGGYCLMLGGTRQVDRDLRAVRQAARARARARLAALRAERRRPLRQDDPQRHRVRHDAGARRGLRAALRRGQDLDIDVGRLAETWRHGSVVRSWLLDLCADILKDEAVGGIAPVVADSGEGRWTALEAIELGVPAPAITAALMNRFSSQGRSDYTRRLLAMMRARFGGHATEKLPPG